MEPLPLLLLEQPVRPKADLKGYVAMLGIAFDKGIQVQGCYALLFRHCFPDCSDDDLMAMVQKLFDAPTQDEPTEQELVHLMREALLAVDPAEAEHFKVRKEAFQRVDFKKRYGVKRLRENVERNFEGDGASPMRSTPSWLPEWVPTKHEGVAKLHSGTRRAERDMDCAGCSIFIVKGCLRMYGPIGVSWPAC